MLGEDSYMGTNMMVLEPKGIDPEMLSPIKIQENTLESLSSGIGGGVQAQANFSKIFTKLLKDSLKSDEKFGKIEL